MSTILFDKSKTEKCICVYNVRSKEQGCFCDNKRTWLNLSYPNLIMYKNSFSKNILNKCEELLRDD